MVYYIITYHDMLLDIKTYH